MYYDLGTKLWHAVGAGTFTPRHSLNQSCAIASADRDLIRSLTRSYALAY